MFYYHNQLLRSMFLSLFETSRQFHNNYDGTRITNNYYRPHFWRTNIKQLTILYKVQNSAAHFLDQLLLM